jgi:phage shock protein PspC (stress-responsive transcriptional regulator)
LLRGYDEPVLPDPSTPLVRSTREAKVGGVCAGLARWVGWDPTLVRVLFVVVVLVTGFFPGLIAYPIFWMVMPADDRP